MHKVVQKRIYSLVIHPSETSLVIAAGNTNGNIGNINCIEKLILLLLLFLRKVIKLLKQFQFLQAFILEMILT